MLSASLRYNLLLAHARKSNIKHGRAVPCSQHRCPANHMLCYDTVFSMYDLNLSDMLTIVPMFIRCIVPSCRIL